MNTYNFTKDSKYPGMSANIDQRSKGQPNQVSNGGKDVMKVDEAYLQQQPPQQHPVRSWSDQATDGQYGAPPMSNAGVSDSFFQSYYTPNMSYPFMNQGLGASEGPWSNGADGMFGMGYDYSSVYSGFGFPFGNWEYAANDYWGSSQPVRKDQRGYPSEDAYYPPEMIPPDTYGMMNGGAPAPHDQQEPIGTVEQGLRGMTIQPSSSNIDTQGRKKIDMSQPPVMSDGFNGVDPSLMMPPPSSQSVSASSVMGSSGGGQPKKTSWAAIASQPARPQQQLRPRTIPRAPVNPNRAGNMDIGTWDMRGNPSKAPLPVSQPQSAPPPTTRQTWTPSAISRRQMPPQTSNGASSVASSGSATINANNSSSNNGVSNNVSGHPPSYSIYSGGNGGPGARSGVVGGNSSATTNGENVSPAPSSDTHPVLDKLKSSNLYNPKEFNLNPKSARFFIIKSYSEDDIHRSIKYSIWCSTEHGNKRLDQAFREREGKGPVYLIYSVNGSGHFCGIAQMLTPVDYSKQPGVWAQDKWKGQFQVKWVYVKDVPNAVLRHIRLENNENKPVTNSRDTQEVPPEKGKQVLRIMHSYKHNTSIFDDFIHYEKRQEEDAHAPAPPSYREQRNDRDNRGGDRGGNSDHRGGDRGGDRGDRGGDRGDRGGDRVDRGGDRGDRGGDRDGQGGRNRDNRRRQN